LGVHCGYANAFNVFINDSGRAFILAIRPIATKLFEWEITMNILSKQSWIALAQVAAVFTIIIFLAVFFINSPTAKEGALMWSWGILGAFTALKLRTFPTKQ
jgi:hypothetical protein